MAAAAVLLSSALSCTKEGVKGFEGSWSYKVSGTVNADVFEAEAEEASENVELRLANEQGQMHIVRSNENDMILTMNAIGGDVVVFDATVNAPDISLGQVSKNITLEGNGLVATHVTVTADGRGTRYDDVIIIDMNCSGSFTHSGKTYRITGSEVKCVAVRNED